MPELKPAQRGPEEFRLKEPGEDSEYDAWFNDQVQIGIDEAERGELISHEEMKRWFAQRIAELERRMIAARL